MDIDSITTCNQLKHRANLPTILIQLTHFVRSNVFQCVCVCVCVFICCATFIMTMGFGFRYIANDIWWQDCGIQTNALVHANFCGKSIQQKHTSSGTNFDYKWNFYKWYLAYCHIYDATAAAGYMLLLSSFSFKAHTVHFHISFIRFQLCSHPIFSSSFVLSHTHTLARSLNICHSVYIPIQ